MPDIGTDAFARELRIAPVMTGGTSLAVWMGGVTAELYRVLMSTREQANEGLRIYRELLELTNTQPRVDVVTGTSAGGLNGAILSAGWHLNLPVDRFMAMREIWLDIGDINELLRSPNESDPPSLLRGDDYFVPKLRDALNGWSGYGTDYTEDRPLDLLITVTTVAGEPRTRYDSFDQPIGEQRYDHSLNFVRTSSDDGDRDDFSDRRWIDQLATAARTSASIPGVFEPSYLRVLPETADRPVAGRPNFAGHASFSVSRWAVDGGVLNNLPLGAAINRIFVQRAGGEVRRVVLYVMPTPSLPPEAVADDPGEMPKLARVIAGVAGATWAQGVANDIDRLREHNLRASRQRAGRVTRFRQIVPDDLFPQARQVWAQYRDLRALTSVAAMLDTAGRELTDPLRADQVDVEAALRAPRETVMPAPPADDGTPSFGTAAGGRPWGWGISSLEQAVAVSLGIIGSALALPGPRQEADVAAHVTHRVALGNARDELYSVLSRLHAVRRLDRAFWSSQVRDLGTRLRDLAPGAAPAEATVKWAKDAYAQWPFVLDDKGMLVRPQEHEIAAAMARITELAATPVFTPDGTGDDHTVALLTWVKSLGERIAELLAAIAVHARGLSELAVREITPDAVEALLPLRSMVDGLDRLRPGSPDNPESFALTPAQTELVDRLRDLVSQLDLLAPAGASTVDVLRRLLAMHVLDTAFETQATTNEQVLELLQVSWNAPNELDARAPAAKLTGNEVARLGAFLKRSWRANDWMWGRLDGAHRMLTLLLDPARLRQLRCSRDHVVDTLRAIVVAVDTDPAQPFTREWDLHAAAIEAELAFLDPKAGLATPKSLPRTVKVLSYVVQTQICVQELPVLHDAMQQSLDDGGHEGDGGAFRLLYQRKTQASGGRVAASDAPELLRAARVGEESAADEIGHDMITRTAGQTAAVAVKVLTGASGQVPLLSRVARPLRAPSMLLYGLTRAMTTDSHVARFLLATALAVLGALLGVRIGNEEAISGTVAGIAALLFITALAVALLRSRAVTGLPALVLLAVIGLALAGAAGMRDIFYDTAASAPTWKRWGFIDPWSAVLVLLILVTIASLVGFGRAAAKRWRTRPSANLTPEQWEASDRAGYYRLFRRGVLIVLLLPVAMFTVQRVFERLMLGFDVGVASNSVVGDVKQWLVKAAGWLDGRGIVLLVVALAVFGAVIGLGYDKLVGTWLWPAVRRAQRSVQGLGRHGTPEGKAGDLPTAPTTPLPHPWSRLTGAQRWALFVASLVVGGAAAVVIASTDLPRHGLLSFQFDGSEGFSVWDTARHATGRALIADYAFLVAYGVGLSLVVAWFASRWNTDAAAAKQQGKDKRFTRALQGAHDASLAAWLPLVAAAFDSLENATLLGTLAGRSSGWADLTSVFAYWKWAFLAATLFALVYESIHCIAKVRWNGTS